MEPTATVNSYARPSRSALPRGARLDRYVVLEPLGSGGMGVVYRAFDPRLDRRIALKLVHPSHLATPAHREQRQRLAQEAKALARLSHPNVLTVHDIGRVGSQLYVAMELVDGDDLATWLRAEPRPLRRILDVLRQAASGLNAAHEAGIVHCDFKLGNVMVGRDGRARVVDFGLASMVRAGMDAPSARARVPARATPTYAAPEQLARRLVSAASDQFSFCVALYRALLDTRPFCADAPNQPHEPRAWRLDEMALSHLPKRVRTVLRRGLSFAPQKRYPSMQALLAALGSGASGQPSRRLLASLTVLAVSGWAAWQSVNARARSTRSEPRPRQVRGVRPSHLSPSRLRSSRLSR